MPTKCLKCNKDRKLGFESNEKNQWWCNTCLNDSTCEKCGSTQEVKIKFYSALPPSARCKDCRAAENELIWWDRDRYYNLARAQDIGLFETLRKQIESKDQELQTEKETTQQALQTSQEWHERQKAEIISQKEQTIAELNQKLTTYLTQRKSSLTHEIPLIKEALHD